jgi:membrane protease YdiL (CAAX protease family)
VNPYPALLLRIVKTGLGVYPLLVWGLWLWSPLGFWACAYLALIIQLLPLLGLAQLPLADDEGPLPRVSIYLSSGAFILVLGWIGLIIGTGEVGRIFMGLGPVGLFSTLFWALVTTVTIHLVLALFFVGRRVLGIRESGLLDELLPRTAREKLIFSLLSLSAGIGEELAFRGFAIPVLTLLTGSAWGAAVLSSGAFGLLHGYQGWLGVFRTGAMGFLLAASLILSDSLWPAIIAHAALDLVSGLILGRTLLRES